MSHDYTRPVWENPEPRGVARYVLLCLADHANAAGESWPSVRTIARETRCSENNVRRALHALAAAGYVSIRYRRRSERLNDTSLYTIRLPLPGVPIKQQVPAKGEESTGQTASRVPAKQQAEPPLNRQESSEQHAPKGAGDSKPAKKGRKPRGRNPVFDALAEVTGADSGAAGSYIGKTAADLGGRYTAEQIRAWYGPGGWWYTVHCVRMDPIPTPSLAGIAKSIGLAAKWQGGPDGQRAKRDGGGVYV